MTQLLQQLCPETSRSMARRFMTAMATALFQKGKDGGEDYDVNDHNLAAKSFAIDLDVPDKFQHLHANRSGIQGKEAGDYTLCLGTTIAAVKLPSGVFIAADRRQSKTIAMDETTVTLCISPNETTKIYQVWDLDIFIVGAGPKKQILLVRDLVVMQFRIMRQLFPLLEIHVESVARFVHLIVKEMFILFAQNAAIFKKKNEKLPNTARFLLKIIVGGRDKENGHQLYEILKVENDILCRDEEFAAAGTGGNTAFEYLAAHFPPLLKKFHSLESEIETGGQEKSENKSDRHDLRKMAEMLVARAVESAMKVDRATGGAIDFAYADPNGADLTLEYWENPRKISLDGLEDEDWQKEDSKEVEKRKPFEVPRKRPQ